MATFRNLLRRTPAYRRFLSDWQDSLESALGSGTWSKSRQAIPEEAVHLFAMDQLYAQVHQNGFAGLFDSPASAVVDDARDGFAAVGLPGIATTIKRAQERNATDAHPDYSKEDNEFYGAAHTEGMLGHPKYVPFADAYALQARQRLEGRAR